MEELIFFGIIILFSIIESIARARKKKGGARPLPEEWEWEDDDVPTYDSQPSYDDAYEEEPEPERPRTLPGYAGPSGSRGAERAPAKSSEGMIPADIWEEIAGLAGGRRPTPQAPPPPPRVEVEHRPARPIRAHPVHRAHAGYGTDPSSRPKSEQDGLDPLARTLSKDAAAVRRQLRSHRRSALRRAVILHEVLGPPAADRPERFTE